MILSCWLYGDADVWLCDCWPVLVSMWLEVLWCCVLLCLLICCYWWFGLVWREKEIRVLSLAAADENFSPLVLNFGLCYITQRLGFVVQFWHGRVVFSMVEFFISWLRKKTDEVEEWELVRDHSHKIRSIHGEPRTGSGEPVRGAFANPVHTNSVWIPIKPWTEPSEK
jgi:hypothetical protein